MSTIREPTPKQTGKPTGPSTAVKGELFVDGNGRIFGYGKST
jgi:hypothetical protein